MVGLRRRDRLPQAPRSVSASATPSPLGVLDQPGPRLPIGAHEAPRRVGAQPLARGRQAEKAKGPIASPTEATTWPTPSARAAAGPVPAGACTRPRPCGSARPSGRRGTSTAWARPVVEPAPAVGALAHGQRVGRGDRRRTRSPRSVVYAEVGPGRPAAARKKLSSRRDPPEAVWPVVLSAFSSGRSPVIGRGPQTRMPPFDEPGDGRGAGRRDGVLRPGSPSCVEEAAGDGGDQRRVERGEPRELDADVVAHESLPSATATPEGARSCGSPETVVRCMRR